VIILGLVHYICWYLDIPFTEAENWNLPFHQKLQQREVAERICKHNRKKPAHPPQKSFKCYCTFTDTAGLYSLYLQVLAMCGNCDLSSHTKRSFIISSSRNMQLLTSYLSMQSWIYWWSAMRFCEWSLCNDLAISLRWTTNLFEFNRSLSLISRA
jgi:hypothetical protein